MGFFARLGLRLALGKFGRLGLGFKSNTKGLRLGLESKKVGLYPSKNLTDYSLTHDYFVAKLQA